MRSMRHVRSFAALALLAAQWLLLPQAAAVTTCSATQPALSFGNVSSTGMTDAQGTFSVTCNTFGLGVLARTRVTMCLNIGDGASGGGNFNPRRMLNPSGDALQFQIFQNPARTTIWGSRGNPVIPTPVSTQFDYSVPLLGGSQTQNFTLHGRIPVQAAAAGDYSNNFGVGHTSIEFRYVEGSALFPPAFPASCISGGTAGVTASFPFLVTATVPNNCTISAATNLNFGTIPGLISANRDQTSAITFTCTGRTAWNVALNNGQNASGSTRRMRMGTTGSHVNYELYRDPGRTQRWGATTGTNTVPGTGTGSAQTLTVYGRVPATQAVPAGDYRDVITVTVTY